MSYVRILSAVSPFLLLCSCPPSSAPPPDGAPQPGQSTPGPIPFSGSVLVGGGVAAPEVPRDAVTVVPSVKPYPLPIKARELINLERDLRSKGFLADPEAVIRDLLLHGMAIGASKTDFQLFSKAYQHLATLQVPVMVTSDSLLHLYHLFFGEILKAIETERLSPMVQALLLGLHGEVAALGGRVGPALKEPYLNELAFLSVPLKLLDPAFEVRPEVRERVEKDLKLIEAHAGLSFSWALSSLLCLKMGGQGGRCYHEDFSQYVPRGHYTQSEALRRYFKATMWLGRIGHRFKYPDEVLQGALLVQAMKTARCRFQGNEYAPADLLARLDQVLRFFIGTSDDLNVFDVDPTLRKHLPAGTDLHLAAATERMGALVKSLRALRAPRILSGAVEAVGRDAQDTVKQETQGLRLLGQRFAPDSEMLGRMVYEFVGPDPRHPRYAEVLKAIWGGWRPGQPVPRSVPCGLTPAEFLALPKLECAQSTPAQWRCICETAKEIDRGCRLDPACRKKYPEEANQAFSQVCRLMPTGLDVAAVLGSATASTLTRPAERYCGYAGQRRKLASLWGAKLDGAPENLYLSWLGVLRPLLAPLGKGYPTWMQGEAFAKKSLRTALASWAELRHDTILYVKQSYTMHLIRETSARPMLREAKFYGTVEPLPRLILGLKRLTVQTRRLLAALEVLPREVDQALGQAEDLFVKLDAIVAQELSEKPLSGDQVDLINGIGKTFERLIGELTRAVTPPRSDPVPQGGAPAGTSVEGKDEAFKTTLVADVHTDLNTKRVLEQGVGPIEWMVVVNRGADGALSVSVGAVFSHYEFTHTLSDRLTNEGWREMLSKGAVPPPRWWSAAKPLANGFELFCTPKTPGCEKQ